MLEPSISPRTAIEGGPSDDVRTLGDLDEALTKLLRPGGRHLEIPAEVLAWHGVDQLDSIAREYTGRPIDVFFVLEWVRPRVASFGEPDPWVVPITRAADLFRQAEDVFCVTCQERHPGLHIGHQCHRCWEEAKARHRETMSYLIIWASCVRTGSQSEKRFTQEVGPEIRHLATKKFGHPAFSLDTWDRLVDWLIAEHASEGEVPGMLRSRVVELLRGNRRLASPRPREIQPDNEWHQRTDIRNLAELMRRQHPRATSQILLLEFMAEREFATCLEVAERVHDHEKTSENTIRKNAERVNEFLAGQGIPVSFNCAGGRVTKLELPE